MFFFFGGRPGVALLFWFFGGFGCGAFVVCGYSRYM